MTDLSVEYLGVKFKNPLVVSSCSLTRDVESIMGLVDAGVGGIVTKTISEDLLPPQPTTFLTHRGMQFVSSDQRLSLEEAVRMVAEVKSRTDVPVIANLISISDDANRWTKLAQQMEAAGADMIEIDLNAHLTDEDEVLVSPELAQFQPPSVGAIPRLTQNVVSVVEAAVQIPVITKISPVTVDMISIAKAAIAGGTDGLSLLNAAVGLPGVNIHQGGRPLYEDSATQGFSMLFGEAVAPAALWVTAQFGKLFDTPMISGGGVMNGEQVIERIMLGAHLAGICAVLYRDGHGAVPRMLSELDAFLGDNGHESPEAFRGAALGSIGTAAFWPSTDAEQ